MSGPDEGREARAALALSVAAAVLAAAGIVWGAFLGLRLAELEPRPLAELRTDDLGDVLTVEPATTWSTDLVPNWSTDLVVEDGALEGDDVLLVDWTAGDRTARYTACETCQAITRDPAQDLDIEYVTWTVTLGGECWPCRRERLDPFRAELRAWEARRDAAAARVCPGPPCETCLEAANAQLIEAEIARTIRWALEPSPPPMLGGDGIRLGE